MKLIDQLGNEWKRVLILDHHLIQLMVILDQPKGPVLLLDEKGRRGHQGLQRVDLTGCEIFLDKGIKLFLLIPRKRVDLTVLGSRPWEKFNGMVPDLAIQECIETILREYLLTPQICRDSQGS